MSRGCQDQLLVSKMITPLAETSKASMYGKDLFKKEHYSLPYTWIANVMEIYQICPRRRGFVEALVKELKA